ncbi:hypothetical protein WJX73_007419 [Symbiochloris irregularis]|uniref:Uncharacterized protein n=1 Tax=Symbiochloris irregularis TaxID=706552 RepID=A0AAW1P4A2_9CHLO
MTASKPWLGLTCDGSGRVTEMHLYELGPSPDYLTVQLTLPGELDRLTAVTYLDLGSAAVSGTLPATWGANGGFANVGYIGIVSSPLGGSLPSEWAASGRFPKLYQLAVQDCHLSGSLPSSWGSANALPKLRSLVLDGNQLTGSVPDSWQGREFTGRGLEITGNPAFMN